MKLKSTLFLYHIFLITLSNLLVQYPFELLGFHTTWGAFTYPAIFILTDLTTRLSTPKDARKVIFQSMFPGLLISYLLVSYMELQDFQPWTNLFSVLHTMPLRIALACFVAYVTGQLLDITVFQRYRNNRVWWLAPVLSTSAGNTLDTVLFFAIAFYQCNNSFLSTHWVQIAEVDIFFKCTISLVAFVPLYGVILNNLLGRSYSSGSAESEIKYEAQIH